MVGWAPQKVLNPKRVRQNIGFAVVATEPTEQTLESSARVASREEYGQTRRAADWFGSSALQRRPSEDVEPMKQPEQTVGLCPLPQVNRGSSHTFLWGLLLSSDLVTPVVDNQGSVVQSRPFDLLVFPFCSIFSHGTKQINLSVSGPLGN